MANHFRNIIIFQREALHFINFLVLYKTAGSGIYYYNNNLQLRYNDEEVDVTRKLETTTQNKLQLLLRISLAQK